MGLQERNSCLAPEDAQERSGKKTRLSIVPNSSGLGTACRGAVLAVRPQPGGNLPYRQAEAPRQAPIDDDLCLLIRFRPYRKSLPNE